MKKFNILLLFVTGLLAFSACTDSMDPVINSMKDSDNKAISFVLNTPSNSSYTLIAENANSIIDIFTCEQPNYGFPAAVTYTVQVCKGNNEFKDFQALATKVQGEKIPIKTFELNDAMNALKMSNSKVAYTVDFRLKAFINDSVPVLYSNTVSMTVTPYSGARTPMYFVGNIFNNGWNNNDLTMRIFADSDMNDMLYTYTGYVKSGSEFKIIQNPGDWGTQWGYGSDGVLSTNGGNIGGFAADGYYTMTFDLNNNKYTITPYTGAVTEYNQISFIGAFNGWGADLDLTQSSFDKHIWINTNVVIPSDGELKLRVNHDWGTSFGGSNGLWKEKQGQFAKFDGGDNVKVKAGTYFVKFNDITKHIIMIAK
jgi:hypothetical protein